MYDSKGRRVTTSACDSALQAGVEQSVLKPGKAAAAFRCHRRTNASMVATVQPKVHNPWIPTTAEELRGTPNLLANGFPRSFRHVRPRVPEPGQGSIASCQPVPMAHLEAVQPAQRQPSEVNSETDSAHQTTICSLDDTAPETHGVPDKRAQLLEQLL